MPDAHWTQGFPHIVQQTSSKYRGVRVPRFTERAGDGKAVMLIHRGHLLEQVQLAWIEMLSQILSYFAVGLRSQRQCELAYTVQDPQGAQTPSINCASSM